MKLIVGLGNPGAEYQGTRHNLGFEVVDELARRWGARLRPWKSRAHVAVVPGREVVLARPDTFMNLSGQAVGDIAAYYRVDPPDVFVVADEINLPLARLRARRAGSDGGHNGLKSVIQYLGLEFPRLRIGVGRGDPRRDMADHVLSRFAPEERDEVARAVTRAADAAEMFVSDGIDAAMNRFNAADDRAGDEERR